MANNKALVDSCVFVDAFDPQSPNHAESLALLDYLLAKNLPITMPAHAWFEVQCALQWLTQQGRFVGPSFQGQMKYPVELIHIDAEFIQKYKMVDIPYLKAGDHIFVAVAKRNGYSLITSDGKMLKVAKECGVRVFHPKDLTEVVGNDT